MPGDPLDALRASAAARDALEQAIGHQVTECRRAGISWKEIAVAAGVPKATAMFKWKEKEMTAATTVPSSWNITEGERVRRRDLHERFGGNIQSGIAPSARTEEILLFSSPSGESHGYSDGINPDGTYTYTGEGQRGDQEMIRGNAAILKHRENGKRLRLFQGDGTGMVTYLGEYEYDTHRIETIPGSGSSPARQGIVFTLRKV